MLKVVHSFPLMSFSEISPTYMEPLVVTIAKLLPAINRAMHNIIPDFANVIKIHGTNNGKKLNKSDSLGPNFSTAHPAKIQPGIAPSRKLDATQEASSFDRVVPIGEFSDVIFGRVGDDHAKYDDEPAIESVAPTAAQYCIYRMLSKKSKNFIFRTCQVKHVAKKSTTYLLTVKTHTYFFFILARKVTLKRRYN